MVRLHIQCGGDRLKNSELISDRVEHFLIRYFEFLASEIFADRNYLNDGWLVPRTRPDALLRDAKEAAARVLRMLREGKVRSVEGRDVAVRGETICVHGDTPGAVEFARELRMQLEREGVTISAPRT